MIKKQDGIPDVNYQTILGDIANVIDAARRSAARSVNCIMTAAYWLIGRRIVEFEQKGQLRAEYGEELIGRLAADLAARYGRGFSVRNVWQMKAFYLAWPIPQTSSAESEGREIMQTVSAESSLSSVAALFTLPWSAYVRLLSVKNENARHFYETEALRGGWSVRQLDRQIDSQFYERTALSKNKAAMLAKGAKAKPEDKISAEEQIKDPYILEFLGLKDEYSETGPGRGAYPASGDLSPGAWRGFLLHWQTEASAHRRRMVSVGPPLLSPRPAMPGDHRLEDRQVYPR